MTRISTFFQNSGRKALIAYLTVGYPDLETTLKVSEILESNGCDMLELGIPFSDPLADGATIQKASHIALKNGVTLKICLQIASEIRKRSQMPLLFMTYYNPILKYGAEKFYKDAHDIGIDGIIIPDLPADENEEIETYTSITGLDTIYLITPNTAENRIKLIANKARGFIYFVSVTGVTGARELLPPNLSDLILRVKNFTRLPVCIGFGISRAEQIQQIAKVTDGIIIGSRIIQLIEDGHKSAEPLKEFLSECREALDS